MSNITSTIRPLSQVEAAGSPKVYNVVVPLANTEVAQLLTTSTKSFVIRVRGVATLKLAFVLGDSGTTYLTIPPNCSYSVEGLNFVGSLYFQTNKVAQVVEILEWS